MRKTDFNRGWRFRLERDIDEFSTFGFDKYSDAGGAAGRFYEHSAWRTVDLPHDWAVELEKDRGANTFAGAYPNTHYHRFTTENQTMAAEVSHVGWYRKQFAFDPAWAGKRVAVEFEGVYRDATVWVNGVYLDRHTSGYTSFALDLTDHLLEGEENSIAVRVDSDQPEGWWYEGAGIYRNVKLLIGEPTHFAYCKTFVRAETDGRVSVSATLVNDTDEAGERTVHCRILDAAGAEVATAESRVQVRPYEEAPVSASLAIDAPALWSVDHPYLYTMELTIGEETEAVTFGVRSVAFDADRGFLLNGEPIKIRGACVHQDLGGVGIALTDNLQVYKIRRLKEMGVNAYRCSHNAPSPALLDACDRLGMLVMDETRMFGTSPEAVRQLTSLIERDRNHPSIFIWSLGNEEFSVQDRVWSFRLMEKMTRIAKRLDPTRPVTYGGNNGPNSTGANGASEIRGVNYIRNDGKVDKGRWLDVYHAAHPRQPIIGTEESSYVVSRGGAVNDIGNRLLDATGNVTMEWGSTPKGWVKFFEERDFLAGSFMWTGFDYRGEPNSFQLSNVSSSFGTIDLCGMEKPPFYYYKAWWTDEPTLKIAPHWNHKRGDTVTVAVFTNCEEITLYVNGRRQETRRVERFDAPMFTVPYEAGELLVEGTRNGETLRDSLVTAGETAEVRCTPVLAAADGGETAIYQLDAYDAAGRFCPVATDALSITVQNGRIVGVGNGDPADWAPEQYLPREIVRIIPAFNSTRGLYVVPPKARNTLTKRIDRLELEPKCETYEDDLRNVVYSRTWPIGRERVTYTAILTDAEPFAYVEFERFGCPCEVFLNGEKIGDNHLMYGTRASNTNRPYRFYGDFVKGENELKVVAMEGDFDLAAMSGYVKLGALVDVPAEVRLYYGRARVFVRSDTPEAVVLTVTHKQ